MLAALGAVAVETQSLVGQELVGARVDGSANGNTTIIKSAKRRNRETLESRRKRKIENSGKCLAGSDGQVNSRNLPKDDT